MLKGRSILKRCFGTYPVKPRVTQLFIDGKFVNSSSKSTFDTINPHNEEVIATVQEAKNEDVDRAVEAARRAFDDGPWRRASGQERCNTLLKLADLIEKNRDELSLLEALNNGKSNTMANMVDMDIVINCIRYYAGWSDKITGDTIPLQGDYFGYVRREPIGVCGQIIPWNFPLAMMAWKLGPALATGCTVVMKTAEQTPLTALRMAELIKEAGIPDGVVNILSGYGETIGRYMVTHSGIDKIAFTGSTEVGLEIQSRSATNGLKHVSLELGGKSPAIVMHNANLDVAANWVHGGLFFNSGQCCNAGSRVLVHEKIYDDFVERCAKLAKKVKYGDQFDPQVTQGSLVSKEQQDKVLGYIKSGQKEGATLVTGGKKVGDKGFHVEPTVFADVKDNMKISREEIFGPVLSLSKYSDTDEAISRANDTSYGLAAAVYTEDINDAIKVSNALRAGQVYVNCYSVVQTTTPFGGFKNSGIGRELGKSGLNNYLEYKTVVAARPSESLP